MSQKQPDQADELVKKLFVITVLGAVVFVGIALYIVFM